MSAVSRNAHIQAIYREVNEGIALINAEWESAALELLCECGTTACTERVEMTFADYEALRAHPTRFVLRPGHEDESVERVLVRSAGYLIVANHGPAAEIAVQTDPRTRAR